MKKTEKTLSIPKSKKIKIFSIAALSKAHVKTQEIRVMGKLQKQLKRVMVKYNWIFPEIGDLSLNQCLWVNAKQNWIP